MTKHEFCIEKPKNLQEKWPGQYEVFSWLEYVVNIPYPIFIITTYKANGKANANLWSWGFFAGEESGFYSLIALTDTTHTYENIKRTKEWCINIPSLDFKEECFKTIEHNQIDDDEIEQAGFTKESSICVYAPRIKECPICLECKFEWEKSLFKDSSQKIICGKIVQFGVDEKVVNLDQKARIEKLKIMYNFRSQLNPLTGELTPGGISIIDKSTFSN
ncbi:MAG: flavin reductase [Atribacterota bacterium]